MDKGTNAKRMIEGKELSIKLNRNEKFKDQYSKFKNCFNSQNIKTCFPEFLEQRYSDSRKGICEKETEDSSIKTKDHYQNPMNKFKSKV